MGGGARTTPFFVRYTRRHFHTVPTADFHQIWPRFVCVPWKGFGRDFLTFSVCGGSFAPKNLKIESGQTGTLLRPAYNTVERYTCSTGAR